MKILFCWSDISGYMASCWRALDNSGETEVHIIAFGESEETSFQKQLTEGLEVNFVSRDPSVKKIQTLVKNIDPDVIVIGGWFIPAYKALVNTREFERKKFVLTMDTPWWGKPRQHLGTVLLKSYVEKFDAILTSGERSYQYARRLGANKVYKMQYGVDAKALRQAYDLRIQRNWPKKFLFVGRYAEEKGLNTLVEAYKDYWRENSEAWKLETCGQGPLKEILETDGITDHGFVQPEDMIVHWKNAGCLVLTSTFDPWPLIVVEACAAGLPVIVTHASGSQVEVVKMYYNGLVIQEDSVSQLTKALNWIPQHYDLLPQMGENSLKQAEPYSAENYAKKMSYFIEDLF